MRTAQICPTCATYTNSICVIYGGIYLSNINATPLNPLDTILANINSTVGGINTSITNINNSIISINSSIATINANSFQSVVVTLDNAAITSGLPMQLIAAPGVGKFIDVISVKSIFTPGGTPLTSAYTFGQIKYGTLNVIQISPSVLTINGVPWFAQYPLNPGTTSQQLPFVENDPVVLELSTPMTGGVGNTIKVYITYRIVTI